MTINLNGQELYINDQVKTIADSLSDIILQAVQAKTKDKQKIQLFYALVISLHIKTGEMLHLLDVSEIDMIMKLWKPLSNEPRGEINSTITPEEQSDTISSM